MPGKASGHGPWLRRSVAWKGFGRPPPGLPMLRNRSKSPTLVTGTCLGGTVLTVVALSHAPFRVAP